MVGIKRIFFVLAIFLFLGASVFGQEPEPLTAEQELALDEDVKAEDLEITEPKMLPDHPFYFLKDGWRKTRETFTFNPVAKLELKEKFASERLIEIKKLAEKGVGSKIIKKATDRYDKENEQIKERIMELKEKAQDNPELNSFSEKFTHQRILHHRILQKLEEKVPVEAIEKIKEQKEKHLERFKDVMLKLEEKEKIPEKLENAIKKIRGSEFKEFKNLEILKEIKEKMPEEIKGKIEAIEQERLEIFKEKIENLSTEKQEKLEGYLQKISGEKGKQLEVLEDLKQRVETNTLKQSLETAKERVLKRIDLQKRIRNEEGANANQNE